MREVSGVECDFLGLFGRNMGRVHPDDRKFTKWAVLRCFLKVVLNRYDLVVLPSAMLARVVETNKGPKALLGKLLYRGSYSSWLCLLVRNAIKLVLRDTKLAFVERFSQMTVHRNFFAFFPEATLFKTIVHRTYPKFPNLEVRGLPYWLNIGSYPDLKLLPEEERNVDVFYVGTTNCKAREITEELYEKSTAAGVNFLWQREKVPFETFVEYLNETKVAWSPEGTNWQCWRHYEALYYGAIPLINKPNEDIYHDLVHGETALFYRNVDEAVTLLKDLQSGKLKMKTTCEERRQFVIEKHSATAAGNHIFNITLYP